MSFHQVHQADGSRIRYRRVCEQEGGEVPFAEIAKGYTLPDGGTVVLTKEDFASLPLMTTKTIEVLRFVPANQIDPIYFAHSYYLKADNAGEKPYVLLREALDRSGQVALVKVTLRNREALATLRTRDGVLLLQTMLWPDEVRDVSMIAPPENVAIRPQEVDMAQSYIETLSGDFTPEEYTDSYREALDALIQAKIAGEELIEPPHKVDEGTVIDLMAALRASVEAVKQGRTSPADPAGAQKESAQQAPTTRDTAKKNTPVDTTQNKTAATSSSSTSSSSTSSSSTSSSSTEASGKGGESRADKPAVRKTPARKAPSGQTAAPQTAAPQTAAPQTAAPQTATDKSPKKPARSA